MPEKLINRQVHFIFAPIFDVGDSSGKNNTWIYDRAPEGYVFQLIKMSISVAQEGNRYKGIIGLYDGHEYTHWNIWPGVESRELLIRKDINIYMLDFTESLHGWECKEYTLAARSVQTDTAFKACVVIWYYLKRASRDELLLYAVKHPKVEDSFKHALTGITIESSEAD